MRKGEDSHGYHWMHSPGTTAEYILWRHNAFTFSFYFGVYIYVRMNGSSEGYRQAKHYNFPNIHRFLAHARRRYILGAVGCIIPVNEGRYYRRIACRYRHTLTIIAIPEVDWEQIAKWLSHFFFFSVYVLTYFRHSYKLKG